MFGTDASPTDLANCQAALAAGQSLAGQQAFLRQSFAHSAAEAGAVGGVYGQVLGRGADPIGLAGFEDEIAAGKSLSDVRGEIASSPEAQGKVNDLAHQVLGREPPRATSPRPSSSEGAAPARANSPTPSPCSRTGNRGATCAGCSPAPRTRGTTSRTSIG